MHGGALMTLGDSLGAVCALPNLPAGASTSTAYLVAGPARLADGVACRPAREDAPNGVRCRIAEVVDVFARRWSGLVPG